MMAICRLMDQSDLSLKVQKFKNMLSEIDVVTKSLQSRGHTLAACREDLDVLIECVAEEGEF